MRVAALWLRLLSFWFGSTATAVSAATRGVWPIHIPASHQDAFVDEYLSLAALNTLVKTRLQVSTTFLHTVADAIYDLDSTSEMAFLAGSTASFSMFRLGKQFLLGKPGAVHCTGGGMLKWTPGAGNLPPPHALRTPIYAHEA